MQVVEVVEEFVDQHRQEELVEVEQEILIMEQEHQEQLTQVVEQVVAVEIVVDQEEQAVQESLS